MVRLVHPSAFWRVIAVVAITAVAGLTASIYLYEGSTSLTVREEEAHRTSEHIAVVTRMLEHEVPDRRARIVEFSSTQHFKLGLFQKPIELGRRSEALDEMQQQMLSWEPSLNGRNLRLHLGSPAEETEVMGSLQLSDGSWLHFRTQNLIGEWPGKVYRIAIVSMPMIALLLIAILTLRRVLRPLELLAEAVTHVGSDEPIVLPEQGIPEFRGLIRAYNDMQGRIVAMIKARIEALAAVGHDLKTPLARLRLRVDDIDDGQARDQMLDDLDEMEQMLDSLLTYFRGDDHQEKPRLVDVAVLITSIVDSLQDAGYDITYIGPEHCDVEMRPAEFKRALSNLTNNACQYGNIATVKLLVNNSELRILVEDDGPGIPEEDMQRVLEPFQRLDPARQRNTSGVGLGIPIALRVVTSAGGALILRNRPEGGLCAEVVLKRLPAIHSGT